MLDHVSGQALMRHVVHSRNHTHSAHDTLHLRHLLSDLSLVSSSAHYFSSLTGHRGHRDGGGLHAEALQLVGAGAQGLQFHAIQFSNRND